MCVCVCLYDKAKMQQGAFAIANAQTLHRSHIPASPPHACKITCRQPTTVHSSTTHQEACIKRIFS